MKIPSVIMLVLTLHSCTAPLYTVMPNDLTMLEKAGHHAGGLSFSNSLIWSGMTQLGGHYAYALPYGFRVRTDFNILNNGADDLQQRMKANLQTYGLGLGFHKAFSEKVKWESHLMLRRVSGTYLLGDKDSNVATFTADYGARNINLFSGVRIRASQNTHSEVVVGYQWTNFDPLSEDLQPLELGNSFTRLYERSSSLHHPVVSVNSVYELDDVEVMVFFTFNVYSGEAINSSNYNSNLLGVKISKVFK